MSTLTLKERRRALGASLGMIAKAAKVGPMDASLGENREGIADYRTASKKVRAVIEAWELNGTPTPSEHDAEDLARELEQEKTQGAQAAANRASIERVEAMRADMDRATREKNEAWQRQTDAKIALRRELAAQLRTVREESGLTQNEMAILTHGNFEAIVNLERVGGGSYGVERQRQALEQYQAIAKVYGKAPKAKATAKSGVSEGEAVG